MTISTVSYIGRTGKVRGTIEISRKFRVRLLYRIVAVKRGSVEPHFQDEQSKFFWKKHIYHNRAIKKFLTFKSTRIKTLAPKSFIEQMAGSHVIN